MADQSRFRFFAGVFLIAGVVMMMQILQSRLFSVTTWYHLSFLVISIAMFGLTLGALKVYRGNEAEQRANYGTLAAKACLSAAAYLLFALFIQLFVPLVAANNLATLAVLPLVAIPTAFPYYFAGIAISLSLTRAPYRVGQTYGVDLLGAGAGCLGALAIMELVDTPSGLILIAALAGVAALVFPKTEEAPEVALRGKTFPLRKAAIAVATAAAIVGVINAALPRPVLYPIWIKGRITFQNVVEHDEWNSISRVTVHRESKDAEPYLWGPSETLPEEYKATFKSLIIDGDAGTPITKFDGEDFESLAYLAYDVTNIAYALPDLNDAAIVGVGGGRDALSAKYFGIENVTAMDVNKVQIDLLTRHPKFTSYSNLSAQKGMDFIHSEARSWFRRNEKQFDIVQMSLIDTWAATGAGAFALSENGLYTVEAWTEFMADLRPGGVFTVSRWSGDALNDTSRMLSLAMAAQFERGVAGPRQHIFMVASDLIATIVLSADPFTQDQITAMENEAAAKKFDVIVSPAHPAPEGILGEVLAAESIAALNALSAKQPYDISPPTDMRPFFFNQARFTRPIELINTVLIAKSRSGVLFGQAQATLNLYLIIIFSIVMVGFVIMRPLTKTIEKMPWSFLTPATSYFLLIGLGFMLVEVAMLQALGVFLGHPSYGLGILLFSLILSTGVGSIVSDRAPLTTLPAQVLWGLAIAGYSIFLALNLDHIFNAYGDTALMGRALISVAIIVPLGILLGYGFPTGIRLVEQTQSRATAWLWGVNGAAGVLGSALAIAFNIAFGIDKTLILGGLCYAALAVALAALAKDAAKSEATTP
ncbi:MAG: hypothetical protein HKP25_10600 [Marinicaulis sp.]|nr:hypothetical protein [Marinicaulis sp.]NNL89510.1 hypothetical protein [Marinicaulis sp.]